MNRFKKTLSVLLLVLLCACLLSSFAMAAGDTAEAESAVKNINLESKGFAAGIAIGLACLGGTIGMGMAIKGSVDATSRQPEAHSKIQSMMMLGLVFLETAIIYALVVALLIIFVL